MTDTSIRPFLAGQGRSWANDQSIAYGCGKSFRTVGVELAINLLNERTRGPQGISVHEKSPGPLKSRGASGLKDFELLLHEAAQKARSANWWTSSPAPT